MGSMKNNSGVPTTVIFGLLRAIDGFIYKNKVDNIIGCWDGGSKYRKNIFLNYKGNRKESYTTDTFKEYVNELNTCREYFDKMGLIQAQCRGIEADDIIGYLSARCYEKGIRPIIFSDDKDFFQLSRFNPLYYRPTKMELITKVECEERLKFPPYLLPRVVAFTGEGKDNIPGTADLDKDNILTKVGIGPAKVLKWLKNPAGGWYTVKEAIENIPADDRFAPLVKKNAKQIVMSHKLSRIRHDPKLYEKWEMDFFKTLQKTIDNPPVVKRAVVSSIGEFLEFKSINLVQTLIRIGVKLR